MQEPYQLSLLDFNRLLILVFTLYVDQNGYCVISIRNESGLKISISDVKGMQTGK